MTVPGVARTVSARMSRRDARHGESQLEVRVVETLPEWFDVLKRPLLAGRVLARNDMKEHSCVCVLTEQGVRKLLAFIPPFGRLRLIRLRLCAMSN
ncbi:MAG: hypothetical protein PF904_12680 [Kiritimatiellae bacterium]|jgi:putative ABC transport system permease protein|nr:hypothetical protein [Kiritimatiellia bacterium]